MELDFSSKKLRRQMESEAELKKAFGQLAKPIQMRLGVLANPDFGGCPPARRLSGAMN